MTQFCPLIIRTSGYICHLFGPTSMVGQSQRLPLLHFATKEPHHAEKKLVVLFLHAFEGRFKDDEK